MNLLDSNQNATNEFPKWRDVQPAFDANPTEQAPGADAADAPGLPGPLAAVIARIRELAAAQPSTGQPKLPAPVVELAHPCPMCRHVMPSGLRCRSPRLRGSYLFCYFHDRLHQRQMAHRQPGAKSGLYDLPPVEDRAAIKIAMTEIMRSLIRDEISERKAAILYYGLQIAMQACPLPAQADAQLPETSVADDPELGEHVALSDSEIEELERLRASLPAAGQPHEAA